MADMIIIEGVVDQLALFPVTSQPHIAQEAQMVRGIGDRTLYHVCYITDA